MNGRPDGRMLESFAGIKISERQNLKFSKLTGFRETENFERFNVGRPFDWEPETPESSLLSYLAVKKPKKFYRKDSLIYSYGHNS